MPRYRFQVAIVSKPPLEKSIDHITNTFYVNDTGLTTDAENLADDVATLWQNRGNYPQEVDQVQVRVYDMADAEPREPVATVMKALSGTGESRPREVALCLSYYAGRNVPRLRGRMYVGPWSVQGGGVRPSTSQMNAVLNLGWALGELGGIDVDWNQYSPTNDAWTKVTDVWVDDEWDTVRSRGLKPTSRVKASTSG